MVPRARDANRSAPLLFGPPRTGAARGFRSQREPSCAGMMGGDLTWSTEPQVEPRPAFVNRSVRIGAQPRSCRPVTTGPQQGRPMVIVYLFASLLGALGTVVALSSSSWLMALLCAPLGGSALTLIVAAVVAVR